MPELPEVETVVKGLTRHIVGQKIKNIDIKNARSFLWSPKIKKPTGVFGLTIHSLSRRGKGIIVNLSKDYTLLIHLKMTGQLIYVPRSLHSAHPRQGSGRDDKKRLNLGHPTKDFAEEMPSSHTRVIFELSKGTLYFNDQRKFGWVKLVPTRDIEKDKFISKLGVEPLSRSFNPDVLWQAIQRHPNSPIKSTIMDQSLVTGVGNIYSDEALFMAGIRPDRKGKTITKPETKKLASAIKKVLGLGIKHAGTSIANYKNAEGLPGRMQNYLKVYGRRGLPCPHKCGVVKSIRIGGRSAHFCPVCQK
jgi:formamidopyrimidine-DNA glycosylase